MLDLVYIHFTPQSPLGFNVDEDNFGLAVKVFGISSMVMGVSVVGSDSGP